MDVFQTHSTGYRRASDIPAVTALVVGGGNTGFQIAKGLPATHRVALAIGSRQKPLPQRLLGRDLFWWLSASGFFRASVDSRLGKRLRGRDTLIGSSPARTQPPLRRRDETSRCGRGRTVGALRRGGTLDVDAVVWATGYRSDYSWIYLPVFEDDPATATDAALPRSQASTSLVSHGSTLAVRH